MNSGLKDFNDNLPAISKICDEQVAVGASQIGKQSRPQHNEKVVIDEPTCLG